jgi:hypothetical protein
MGKVLTTDAVIVCTHGGTIKASSAGQSLLEIDGKPVLVAGDLVNLTVSGCPFAQNPCATTTSMTAGEATAMEIDGKAVLLESAKGDTSGGVPWLVVSPGQSTLETD